MDGAVKETSLASSDNFAVLAAELGAFAKLPIARGLTRLFINRIRHPAMQADMRHLFLENTLTGKDLNSIDLHKKAFAIARRYTEASDHVLLDGYYGKIAYLINIAATICDANVTDEFQKRTDAKLASYNADDPNSALPYLGKNEVLHHSLESYLYPSAWVSEKDPDGPQIYKLPVDDVIALEATPEIEDVSTMHPNGSTTLPTAQKLEATHDVTVAFARNPIQENYLALVDVIDGFADPEFSLTPIVESGINKGDIRQSTVSEEGDIARHFALQDWKACELHYEERADPVHAHRYGRAYGLMQKANLTFKRIFGTWAGGNDIDGNSFKAAILMLETFMKGNLEAAGRHLEKLAILPDDDDFLDFKTKWSTIFENAKEKLHEQLKRIENGNGSLTWADCRDIEREASLAFMPYSTIEDLSNSIKTEFMNSSALRHGILPLYRKIRDSDIGLMQNEPRENSAVFRGLMNYLLTNYRHPDLRGRNYLDLNEEQRIALLTDLMRDPDALRRILTALHKLRDDQELQKNPHHRNAVDIIERLEHIHKHRGLVKNILIAETQGADDHILVLALQKMVSTYIDNGHQLRLHICALYEDGPSISKAHTDINRALQVKEYAEHVDALGKVIKIMQPNSDLGAREGPIACIAALARNHYEMIKSFAHRYRVEHHDGKGDSDSSRGGRRDRLARIFQFAAQFHPKGTLQGLMDLLNLMNVPKRWARTLESAFIYCADLISKNHEVNETPLERFVIDAGLGSNEVFKERHLKDDARRVFSGAFMNAKIANKTRNTVSRKVVRTAEGADEGNYIDQELVDYEHARAIAKSKLKSEAGLVHTFAAIDVFLGNLNVSYHQNEHGIQSHLLAVAREQRPDLDIKAENLFDDQTGLTALGYQTLYNEKDSLTFRCIIDFALDGINRSEPELLDHRFKLEEEHGFGDEEYRRSRDIFRPQIAKEFVTAARVVLQVRAHKHLPQDQSKFAFTFENCGLLQQIVRNHAVPLGNTPERQGSKIIGHALRDASIVTYREKLQNKLLNNRITQQFLRCWRDIGSGQDAGYYGAVPSTAMRDARIILRDEAAAAAKL